MSINCQSDKNSDYNIGEMDWEEESKMWQDATCVDCLKDLGPISKEEYDYYENLCSNQIENSEKEVGK